MQTTEQKAQNTIVDEGRPARVARILYFQDSPARPERLSVALKDDTLNVDIILANTITDFVDKLTKTRIDVILVEVEFSAEDALGIALEVAPGVPLLFLVCALDDDKLQELITKGATDCIHKNNLNQLAVAVRRALRESDERKRREAAEQALERSERKLIQFCGNVPHVAVRWYDAHGNVTFWNSAAETFYGWTAEEAIGKRVQPVHFKHVHEAVFADFLNTFKEPGKILGPVEVEFVRKDGSTGVCASTISQACTPQGEIVFHCLDIDLTNQKNAERTLRASAERVARQESALIALTHPISGLELSGAIRQMTEVAAQTISVGRVSFWRYSSGRRSIHCVNRYDLKENRHSSGDELCESSFPTIIKALLESEIVAADDAQTDPFTFELSNYFSASGVTSLLSVPIRIKGTLHGVLWHENTGGRRNWTIDERAFAIAIANNLRRAIEEWERDELEAQYRQSQKTEAVGQLAAGIAHDFNNILSVINLHSSFLQEDIGLAEESKDSLNEISAAVQRAADLTRRLLAFSRKKVKESKDIDLTTTVSGLVKLLKRVVCENVSVESDFSLPLPLVHADEAMVEQVVMNLVLNARDAMPNGGSVTIGLEPVDVSEDRAALRRGVAPGPFVCLSVVDTGCGIEPENISKIFDPFFTTKDTGRRGGLGLATVSRIVDQHRGWIEVQSEPNKGTTFQVFLPAVHNGQKVKRGVVNDHPRGGNEVILFVEDDASLRRLTRSILEKYGYKVIEASTAAAAVARWETNRAAIDLLLTDVILPGGMSGRDLAERLLANKPELKVVFSSGYTNEMVPRELSLAPDCDLLQKPYSSVELAAIVRRSLDDLAAMRSARFAAAVQLYKSRPAQN